MEIRGASLRAIALGNGCKWTWVRLVFPAIVLRARIGVLPVGLPLNCTRISTELTSGLTSDSRRTSL